MGTPASYLPTQIRRLTRVVRAERRVADATAAALADLAQVVATQLAADGYTAVVVDNRAPEWRAALADAIMPVIRDVYDEGFHSETRRASLTAAAETASERPDDRSPADRYAGRYLEEVHNRLTGVADDVFSRITTALEDGRQAQFQVTMNGVTTTETGESIQQLGARVNTLLGNEVWAKRGMVVARTEVISANNAGAHAAARDNAALFGATEGSVIKEWLATSDTRTREAHRDVNHQTVMGLGAAFQVGGTMMQQPGDPAGGAANCVNCRCTALYHYPGDFGYDEMAAELGATSPPLALVSETPTQTTRQSMFTPDQLTTALDPSTRRSSAAITKELEATDAGKNLTAAIKGFTETRGGVANLRKNIAATIDGTASKTIDARARAFLDAVNTYPTDQVPELFRGMAIKVESDTNEWWDAFEGQFKPGQKIDLNASSFTSSEKKAQEFQTSIGGTRSAGRNHTQVRFVLQDGAHALPVEQLSKFKAEREWITGGQFEVVEYLPATKAQPYYRVVIRQVRSLEAP